MKQAVACKFCKNPHFDHYECDKCHNVLTNEFPLPGGPRWRYCPFCGEPLTYDPAFPISAAIRNVELPFIIDYAKRLRDGIAAVRDVALGESVVISGKTLLWSDYDWPGHDDAVKEAAEAFLADPLSDDFPMNG